MKLTAIDLGRARPADYLGIPERDPIQALAAEVIEQIGRGEAARIIGVSRHSVNAWCRGDYRPTQANADKMAEMIGAPRVQLEINRRNGQNPIAEEEAAERREVLGELLKTMPRRDLAARLGIDSGHIGKWVRGRQTISDKRLAQIREIAQGVAA